MEPHLIPGLVLAATILLAGCASNSPPPTSSASPASSTPPTTANATTTSSMSASPTNSSSPTTSTPTPPTVKKTFLLTGPVSAAAAYAIHPAAFTIKNNSRFEVTAQNDDLASTPAAERHSWQLDGYNKGVTAMDPGANKTVVITINKVGTFAYYCTVGGHRGLGMEGTLTVTA